MADSLNQLFLQLELKQAQFEKSFAKAQETTRRKFGEMEGMSSRTSRKIAADFQNSASAIDRSFGAIRTGLAGIGVGLGGVAVLRSAKDLIDANTRVTNSLKVAGLEGDALTKVYNSLFASAQKNAAPIESLATLYGRVSLVQKELGVSTADLLKFTDNVSLALRVAGTDAETASGALLQLSQALGSGTVRAEEFNSILEGAQPIAQAAAAGLTAAGGSVARLRQLVVSGQVSSQEFFAAFQRGAAMLEQKVAGSTLTTGQAMIRLYNVLQDAAGKFDAVAGASASFAAAIDRVAEVVSRLSNSDLLVWLDKLNSLVERGVFQDFGNTLARIETILKIVDSAAAAAAESFEGVADSTEDAVAAALGFEHAADAPKPLKAEIEKLAASVVAGTTDAEALRAELVRLGASPLNLGIQIGQIMDLARAAQVAAASIAAARAAAAKAVIPVWDQPANEDRSTRARAGDEATPFPDQTNLPPVPVKPPNLLAFDPNAGAGGGGGGGGGSRSAAAAAAHDENDAVKDLIGSLEQELALIGATDAERAVANNLRSAGADATDAQKARIEELTRAISAQEEAQDRANKATQVVKNVGADALKGIVSDLMNGKSAADAFAGALDRIASKLADMLIDQALSGFSLNVVGAALGAPGLGGLYADGGEISGPGTGTSDSIPILASNGEFMVNAKATARHRQLLHAINNGTIDSFATGGAIGSQAGVAAAITSRPASAPPSINVTTNQTINLTASGGTPAENDDLAKKIGKEVEAHSRAVVVDEMLRQMRPGGLAAQRAYRPR